MSKTTAAVKQSLRKRYRSEKIFRAMGMMAVLTGVAFVVLLFINIGSTGLPAFQHSYVKLPIFFNDQVIDPTGKRDAKVIARADYQGLVKQSLRGVFPDVTGRKDKRALYRLASSSAGFDLRDMVAKNPELIGTTQEIWFLTDDEVDNYLKGNETAINEIRMQGQATLINDKDRVTVSALSETAFDTILQQMQSQFTSESERIQQQLQQVSKQLTSEESELETLKSLLQEAEAIQHVPGIDNYTKAISVSQNKVSQLEIETRGYAQQLDDYAKVTTKPSDVMVQLPGNASSYLIDINGGLVRIDSIGQSKAKGELIRQFSTHSSNADEWSVVVLETPESDRRVKDKSIGWIRYLQSEGMIDKRFNSVFFTHGDSREPEQAGIAGALVGSFLTLIVTLLLSFPIGVGAAIYLEEFAPKNRWTDIIEVNINNLAAVPSIVFGLLGLAVFINFFGFPRSAPVVGGMVLTLMTLPTIIISSRAALKSVPPSIKQAALGVGASQMQAMFHHTLPLALPGMLTGTIIGMAQALGETAPLLMIGMVAFIVDIPQVFTDNATVLPVQIFLWADSPERAFVEKTSAAIMVLLGFLIIMNALAVILRKKFERQW